MARARAQDIYFDAQEYDATARRVREQTQNENTSCHHGQCRGVTKSAKRCSRCLNERVATTDKLCHSHTGSEQYYKLNRHSQPIVGYDTRLHNDRNAWLADDGMETAIRILHSQIRKKKFTVDFIGRAKKNLYNYSEDGAKIICILLQRDHWFVMTSYKRNQRPGGRPIWWLLDSMPRSALEFQNMQRELEQTVIPAHYGVQCNVVLSDSLKQQNNNDCGFFAINNLVALITGHALAESADMVRHKVLLFLAGRGQA